MNPNDLMLFPPSWRLDPPDPPHPSDEGEWLEPFDGDTGAERDEARHVDYGWQEDW